MFFTYDQNNSGGYFDYDAERGIANYVIVEAANVDEADFKAQQAGVYFDHSYMQDCACCGPRWSEAYGEGTAFPAIYAKDATNEHNYQGPDDSWRAGKISRMFTGSGTFTTFVHYADGRVVGYGKQD